MPTTKNEVIAKLKSYQTWLLQELETTANALERFTNSPGQYRRRLRRGEIEALAKPVLQTLATCTTPILRDAMIQAYPGRSFSRSGIRSYLERQVLSGALMVVNKGSRGSGDPRRYAPRA